MLASTESIDAISGGRLTTEYRYHYGYWDGVDHEFRGFGRVDQTDTETIDLLAAAPPTGPTGIPQLEVPRWCPPVHTRTWFHLGPVGDATAWQELDYSSEYWTGDPATLTRPPAAAAFLAALPRQGPPGRDPHTARPGAAHRDLRAGPHSPPGPPLRGHRERARRIRPAGRRHVADCPAALADARLLPRDAGRQDNPVGPRHRPADPMSRSPTAMTPTASPRRRYR